MPSQNSTYKTFKTIILPLLKTPRCNVTFARKESNLNSLSIAVPTSCRHQQKRVEADQWWKRILANLVLCMKEFVCLSFFVKFGYNWQIRVFLYLWTGRIGDYASLFSIFFARVLHVNHIIFKSVSNFFFRYCFKGFC